MLDARCWSLDRFASIQQQATSNKHRERIWFSPACLSGDGGQQTLF